MMILVCLAQVNVTVAPHAENRKFAVAEFTAPAKLAPPYRLKEGGQIVPCQWEGTTVRWVIASLPAGQTKTFVLEHADAEPAKSMALTQDPGGWISVKSPDREITRYHFGATAEKFKKPHFYPVFAQGVGLARGYPMDPRPDDVKDHPHHTGLYYAHGDVNKKEFWSKLPIKHKRFVAQVSGPVYARIAAENAWDEDLLETQDVVIYDAGKDLVMDWTITLKAENAKAVLGETKEGGFSIRVATPLTDKGGGKMTGAEGQQGEKAIWSKSSPWIDYSGTIEGKHVGVAILNHPTSFRYPTTWHARGYGLFAANNLMAGGAHTLEKGQSIALKFRVYVHAGDLVEGKVAEVFAGYAKAPQVSD